jgi:ElaB/YqjD/DUF883 family membrane-anchored ribosome-binding protein
MTQQRGDYPLDYSNGPAPAGQPSRRQETVADQMADHMKEAGERAQEVAGKLAEQAQELGAKAQDAARNFKPYVEKSMREQPMATLAAASVIGFVLGALWKK